MQKKVEDKISEVALRYRLPAKVVKAIFESQFHCAREEIKKGVSGEPDTFANVKFKHLGRFVAKEGRVKFLKRIKDDRGRRLHKG